MFHSKISPAADPGKRIPLEIRVPLIYALLAALWIYFSDRVVALFAPTPQQVTAWSTYKGWLFVFLTAMLLVGLLRRNLERIRQAQRQLLASESRLREESRRKDEFLMMLSHELRNPLAPIRNAVEVSKYAGGNAVTLARQHAIIERQVCHLTRLFDDLLDLARITRGKIQMHKERHVLREVVEQALETSQILTGPRKGDFSCVLPPHEIQVEVDPTRLVQVIGNLLGNALKYSEAGQRIRLTTGLESSSVTGGRSNVIIRVEDGGMGIEPTLMPHIFDPFIQADQTLARSRGGLGIGLTLSRHIVELHGGSIDACSAGPAQGSTFCVRLPVLIERDDSAHDATAHAPEPIYTAGRAACSRRAKILVVDDNVDEVHTLQDLLAIWGYTTAAAFDGPQALNQFASFAPGIVLLDLGLPGIDGYEVARRIRALNTRESLLLVAVTGYGRDEDRRLTAQTGFDRHLTKPVLPDELRSLLDEFTDRTPHICQVEAEQCSKFNPS